MDPRRSRAQAAVVLALDEAFGRDLPLRGGVLMPLWVGDAARQSEDLDYLVAAAPMDTALSERVIAAVSRPNRLSMVRTIQSEVIKQDTPSPGLRFHAAVEDQDGPVAQQFDIAFDDPVAQSPSRVCLAHIGVEAWAYPVESTFAWKVHELFERPNWRYKHLYDAYAILQRCAVDVEAACAALRLAFVSRQTAITRLERLIDGRFGSSRERPKKWRQFRRRHHYLTTPEDHSELVDVVGSFVREIYGELSA